MRTTFPVKKYPAIVTGLLLACAISSAACAESIIADHTVVDQYDRIPDYWISQAKKMLLSYPGESHSTGLAYGMDLLAGQDSRFTASVTWTGAPENYTDQHLRVLKSHWDGAGWIELTGEEDTWTHQPAIDRINSHFTYCKVTLGNQINAFCFGWCYDMTQEADCNAGGWAGRVYTDFAKTIYTDNWDISATTPCLQNYLSAWDVYEQSNPGTAIIYSTGPVDNGTQNTGCRGYQRELKNQAIRDWVKNSTAKRFLFDYADILSWNDAGQLQTSIWDGNMFPLIHPDNKGSYQSGDHLTSHIGAAGCTRLAKSMWWLLARIAGWDGQAESATTSVLPATSSTSSSTTSAPSTTTSSSTTTTTIKAPDDFDGDGRSDLLWRNSSTGQNQVWLMNGAAGFSGYWIYTMSDMSWQVAGTGDFDGDGKSDLLWRNTSTGQNQVWLMNGTAGFSGYWIYTMSDMNWQVAGTGDFDGDGRSDLLWRNTSTGQNQVWLMNGTAGFSGYWIYTMSDMSWQVAGTGDFDGDGKSDLLWRNTSTGQNQVWLMNGTAGFSGYWIYTMSDMNWQVAGTGDFDGDGRSDLLWRNTSTGQNQVWLMNGTAGFSGYWIYPMSDMNWQVAAAGDFDGDGKNDLLWRNTVTGQNQVWLMNGAAGFSGYWIYPMSDMNWQPVA